MKPAQSPHTAWTHAQLETLARRALMDQDEEHAVTVVSSAAWKSNDARLLHWAGLLYRALDDREAAMRALERAADLAPMDAGIAHGLARVTYEAGRDAVALYERAQRLDSRSGDLVLGTAAAHFANGDSDRAIGLLAHAVAGSPAWLPGHEQLARLRWMVGQRDGFDRSLSDAIAQMPTGTDLWRSWLGLAMHARLYDRADEIIERGRSTIGQQRFFDAAQAELWSETGDAKSLAAFDRLHDVNDTGITIRHVRHLLRQEMPDRAVGVIETGLAGPDATAFFPYASTAWRLTDDPRYDWLDRQPGLIRQIDLSAALPPLPRLAQIVRSLHRAQHQHLDQSVRGGTQTDGILFANVDPDIQMVRRAVVGAVQRYLADLPPPDPAHPTLGIRRDRVPRFAGSWSVRLTDGGYHDSHIHPAGWISSALYLALPPLAGQSDDAGCLQLGAPPTDLGLDVTPFETIAPATGLLALFPSTMWHRTAPFAAGERLTIAFDIAFPA